MILLFRHFLSFLENDFVSRKVSSLRIILQFCDFKKISEFMYARRLFDNFIAEAIKYRAILLAGNLYLNYYAIQICVPNS